MKKQPKNRLTKHAGDCAIYRALINGSPTDGICTCGYGWQMVSETGGDWVEMYSIDRSEYERAKEDFKKIKSKFFGGF